MIRTLLTHTEMMISRAFCLVLTFREQVLL